MERTRGQWRATRRRHSCTRSSAAAKSQAIRYAVRSNPSTESPTNWSNSSRDREGWLLRLAVVVLGDAHHTISTPRKVQKVAPNGNSPSPGKTTARTWPEPGESVCLHGAAEIEELRHPHEPHDAAADRRHVLAVQVGH